MGNKMAKNVPKIAYVGDFLPFLGLLQPLKLHKIFLSSRGGSKLQIGGSYVKIYSEFSSGMNIFLQDFLQHFPQDFLQDFLELFPQNLL